MNLDTTTRSLEVKLGEAITTSQCDITASWGEYTAAGFRPGLSDGATNGVTAVTAVAAPATSEQRVVQEVRVYNADTVPHAVILQLNDNGTIRVIAKQEVAVGGTFGYVATQSSDANSAPAILLESGNTSEKITQLPAFSFATPPTGAEPLPAVEASTTVQLTLAQLLSLMLDWSETIAANPFDATAGNTQGGNINLFAGAGHGSGDGGFILGIAGTGGATGTGGFIDFDAGNGGATSGNGGGWFLNGGQGVGLNANGGEIEMHSGNGGTGVADGGHMLFISGTAGVNGNGGALTFTTGLGNNSPYASGAIAFETGIGSGGADSGVVTVTTGNAGAGSTGAITVKTGDATGAAKVVGDIVIQLGAAAGGAAVGNVIIRGLPTADPLVSGALWIDAGAARVIKSSP